jgi:hypothetical protein
MKRLMCLVVLAAFGLALGGCEKKVVSPSKQLEGGKDDVIGKDERGKKELPPPPDKP